MTSLAKEQVSRIEKDNMWIGPREEDLIHVGAKYSPCMREDDNMQKLISEYNNEIKQTACCVRNDGAGCFQSTRAECPVSENMHEMSCQISTNLSFAEVNLVPISDHTYTVKDQFAYCFS